MIANTRRRSLILISVLMMVLMAQAQTQRQPEAFSVQGYPGQANIFQLQGRALVDVQDLARITHGSLSFEGGRILLLLPRADAPKPAGDNAGPSGFSRGFMRAAIEAMASIREWGRSVAGNNPERVSRGQCHVEKHHLGVPGTGW